MCEFCVNERKNHLTLVFDGICNCVAHEVHAAALSRRRKDLRDCSFEADVRAGDDGLDATETASGEISQEFRPERLGSARAVG